MMAAAAKVGFPPFVKAADYGPELTFTVFAANCRFERSLTDAARRTNGRFLSVFVASA
jgi:hypothetical protein